MTPPPVDRLRRRKGGVLFHRHPDAVRLEQLIEPSFDATQFTVNDFARARWAIVGAGVG